MVGQRVDVDGGLLGLRYGYIYNQSITSWEFFPLLRLQHDRTFSFIFSTICLLTSPRLLFTGFISLHGTLFGKLSL